MSFLHFEGIQISGISTIVPANRVDNYEFGSKIFDKAT